MQYRERWLAAVFVGAGLFVATANPQAAEPINNPPSKVTPIEGTMLSQVTLTPEAAARLGIEITQVRDMEMVRKRIVSGLVLESPEAVATTEESAPPPDAPDQFVTAAGPSSPATIRTWQIQVHPIGELDRKAGSRPARVVPIGALSSDGWLVEPSAAQPLGTVEEASRPLVYNLPAESPGLVGPGRVLVELALSDGGIARKVVPYASLLYSINGDTWIYTNPEPLVFVRHPVQVDYIDNDWVVLSDGPPAGTSVVAVGVVELYGTEFKIGK
jgi:hypothetical protein